jgi:hypothetical protein
MQTVTNLAAWPSADASPADGGQRAQAGPGSGRREAGPRGPQTSAGSSDPTAWLRLALRGRHRWARQVQRMANGEPTAVWQEITFPPVTLLPSASGRSYFPAWAQPVFSSDCHHGEEAAVVACCARDSQRPKGGNAAMPDNTSSGGPRRRWLSRPLALAGTVVLAVAAGAGIALAATTGSSSPLMAAGSFSAAASSPSVPAKPLPGVCRRVVTATRAGILCHRSGLGGALHGTLVLPKADGGSVTVEIQNGKVTSVSQSSITLKSADGYTKTYVVSASTIVGAQREGIGSVKVGDQVWVTATASGGTVTAIRVVDLTQLKAGHLPGLLYPRFHPAAGSYRAGALSGSTALFFGSPASG